MIRVIQPGGRTGSVEIPASKSRAHRLLICASLGKNTVELRCEGVSRDIQATMDCLKALGAVIDREDDRIRVVPVRPGRHTAGTAELPCGESGSTLRFLLPVVGALGRTAVFRMEGRLPERPLQPLGDLLTDHGMTLRREENLLFCDGRLRAGMYRIPGNISSQYVSGLLFALPLLAEESALEVTDRIESADYIAMTEDALSLFGWQFEKQGWRYRFPAGEKRGESTSVLPVERDWSSAAFFLALGALGGGGITIRGMNLQSRQGDRRMLPLMRALGAEVREEKTEITIRPGRMRGMEIDASGIPDLVPILAVTASLAEGETRIVHAERLRLKESDRLRTTTAMLSALGADIRETEDGLLIHGKDRLAGGRVDAANDHRIAMAAAVAAAGCAAPVIIDGAECTEKSFPRFWETLEALERDGAAEDAARTGGGK